MSYPKLLPCPKCKTSEHLDVYRYEGGWQYVECDKCYLSGPGEGSILQAIKAYNKRIASLSGEAQGVRK